MLECTECACAVEAPKDPMVGEILGCKDCGAELELLNLSPLILGLAPEIEEDWGE